MTVAEHVFLETNFVVDWAAPAHHRSVSATELMTRAAAGQLELHVPAICLAEALTVLRGARFQPRRDVDPIRGFLRDSAAKGTPGERRFAFELLDGYETYVRTEVDGVATAVDGLRSCPGVRVFGQDDEILSRGLELFGVDGLTLDPIDRAVLASVLVEAGRLGGDVRTSFCEADGDLRPWNSKGQPRVGLRSLYDAAAVWVYSDFTMTNPPRPDGWP